MLGLPPGVWANGGAIGVLVLVVFFIISGRLRPNRSVQEVRQDRDDRLAECREQTQLWREAYELSEHARERQEALLRDVLDAVRTSASVLEAIRQIATGNGEKG